MLALSVGYGRVAIVISACWTLSGCAIQSHSTRLAGGLEPVDVEMPVKQLHSGQAATLVVRSPGADSIAFASQNGLDRYWTAGPVLTVPLASDFGDAVPVSRFAERWNGELLNQLKKPVRVTSCRDGICREFYHELTVKLPEHNRRSVALTGGWSSVFARRSIRGANRTVLFEEVLNSGVWSVQGEWAANGWSGRAQGFLGSDGRGASLDLSRVIKRGEGLSYGIAFHAGAARNSWMEEGPGSMPGDRTGYRISLGPSIMLRGVTASSQFGIYTDGVETLQIASTRVSVNGNLTSVRQPVTITAEKTFAFGGSAIVSRRREALERLTAGMNLFDGFALNVGLSSHRIAWPDANPSYDLRASETLMTLGGQYSVSW